MDQEVPQELALARDHARAHEMAVLTVFITTGKHFIQFYDKQREMRNTRSGSLGSLSISYISSDKKRFRPLHYYGHQKRVIELNRNYLNSNNLSTTNKNANMQSNRKMLPTGAAGQRLLSNLLGVQSDINPSHAISQLIGKNKAKNKSIKIIQAQQRMRTENRHWLRLKQCVSND